MSIYFLIDDHVFVLTILIAIHAYAQAKMAVF